jgi:hypothetical protein
LKIQILYLVSRKKQENNIIRIIQPWITTEKNVSGIVLVWGIVWGVKISPNKKGFGFTPKPLILFVVTPAGLERQGMLFVEW